MILLFERRMDIVRQVALYKKTRGMPVFQAGREQEVLDKAAARLANKDYADEAKRFMNVVMAISRAAQRRDIGALEFPRRSHSLGGPVAFYGAPGAFTEQALIDYFGDGRESLSCQEFEDVFSALKDGRADYGVLPIENSSTGAITQVYDLLGSYGFLSSESAACVSAKIWSVRRAPRLRRCGPFILTNRGSNRRAHFLRSIRPGSMCLITALRAARGMSRAQTTRRWLRLQARVRPRFTVWR